MKNWVVGTMEKALDAEDHPSLNGLSEMRDPNTVLSPYLNSKDIFHCQADNYLDPNSRKVHVRSYSMNSAVGTIFWTHYNGSPSTPVGAVVGGGWLPGNAYNASQTAWECYGRMASFNHPGPANTWVLMDENPYSINDGSLAIPALATAGNTYLVDYPAGTHAGAAGISFVDGHALIYKWKDPRTYTPQGIIAPGMGSSSGSHPNPDDIDCFYLASITSAPN
jgi:prepilin-type processing-associated H-X9-DG protein